MSNLYFKNRTVIQLFITVVVIFMFYNFISTSADSVKSSGPNKSISEVQLEIITVTIPQGSAASEISSILDATGVVTSKLAFELYLRNENLTNKLLSLIHI